VKITSGPHLGETFTLMKETFLVGRGAENDIILINDPKLSRQHIKVSLKDSALLIENLSSRNPLMYKSKPEHHVEIKPNERVKIGDTEIELSWNSSSLEKTLMAENLTQLTTPTVATTSEATVVASSTAITTFTPPDFKTLISTPFLDKNNPPTLFTPHAPLPEKQGENKNQIKSSGAGYNNSPLTVKGDSKAVKSPSSVQTKNPYAPKPYPQAARRKINNNSINLPLVGAGVIILIVIILSFGGEKKIKKPALIKDTAQLSSELERPNQLIDDYMKEKKLLEDGRMERVYESAQSYYIKGFRDYRQGQYSRAMLSFQAALSFDPNHILSKKYLLQSVKKHAELTQFNLDQAKRYKDKSNYRLCKSSAKQVIIMALRKDSTDPQYKDGKKLFDECDILSKGRF